MSEDSEKGRSLRRLSTLAEVAGIVVVVITLCGLLWQASALNTTTRGQLEEVRKGVGEVEAGNRKVEKRVDELLAVVRGDDQWERSEEFYRTRTAVESARDQLAATEAKLDSVIRKVEAQAMGDEEDTLLEELSLVRSGVRGARCVLAGRTWDAGIMTCTGGKG